MNYNLFGSTFINPSGSAINLSDFSEFHEYFQNITGITAQVEEEVFDLEEFILGTMGDKAAFKISGDSMAGAGIFDGDIAIVEKDFSPKIDDLIIAYVDCKYVIRYLKQDKKGRFYLKAANKNYKNIYPGKELEVFGVVSSMIRKFGK